MVDCESCELCDVCDLDKESEKWFGMCIMKWKVRVFDWCDGLGIDYSWNGGRLRVMFGYELESIWSGFVFRREGDYWEFSLSEGLVKLFGEGSGRVYKVRLELR